MWLRDLSAAEAAQYASQRATLERQGDGWRAMRNVADTTPGSAGFSAPTAWAAFILTGA